MNDLTATDPPEHRAVLAWLWRRRIEPAGTVFWIYMIAYSLGRGVIEFWRGDAGRGLYFGDHVSTSQLLAIAGGLFGLVMLLRGRRQQRSAAPGVPVVIARNAWRTIVGRRPAVSIRPLYLVSGRNSPAWSSSVSGNLPCDVTATSVVIARIGIEDSLASTTPGKSSRSASTSTSWRMKPATA